MAEEGMFRRMCLRIFVLLAVFLIPFEISAAVKVTAGRVMLGGTMRTHNQSFLEFICHVENTDPVPRTVTIKVVYSTINDGDDAGQQDEFFSREIVCPPMTRIITRIPFITGRTNCYDLKVFVDGNALATGSANPALSAQMTPRQKHVAIMNDADDSMGSFTQLPIFKEKLYSNIFNADKIPVDPAMLGQFETLAFYKPDFSKYSSSAFESILSYAANGGNVSFLSPESILSAASTPLAVLLPIEPIGISESSIGDEIKFIAPSFSFGKRKIVPFLQSLKSERGVVTSSLDGMPLTAIRNYGLGTVRTCSIGLEEDFFKDNRDAWGEALGFMLPDSVTFADSRSFMPLLEEMTGFPIPDKTTVLTVVIIFFAGLTIILGTAFKLKRAVGGWIFAALYSVAFFGCVMLYAAYFFKDKGTMLARVKVENLVPGNSGTVTEYCSYFAESEQNLTVGSSSRKGTIGRMRNSHKLLDVFGIPLSDVYVSEMDMAGMAFQNVPKKNQAKASAPLELMRGGDGIMRINALNVRPRSGTQFFSSIPMKGDDIQSVVPEVVISENGIAVEPFNLPEYLEMRRDIKVYLMLPNGNILLEKNNDGLYSISEKKQDEYNLASAVNKAYRTFVPYVCVFSSGTDTALKFEEKTDVRGYDAAILPCTLKIAGSRIKIPSVMTIPFTPSGKPGNILRGNEFLSKLELDGDAIYSCSFALPDVLKDVFMPDEITLEINARLPHRIELETFLYLPDGQVVKGEMIEPYTFKFKSDKVSFESLRGAGNVMIELKPIILGANVPKDDDPFMFDENAFMNRPKWRLNDMKCSVSGTVTEHGNDKLKF